MRLAGGISSSLAHALRLITLDGVSKKQRRARFIMRKVNIHLARRCGRKK
jgi:hypothetical protein